MPDAEKLEMLAVLTSVIEAGHVPAEAPGAASATKPMHAARATNDARTGLMRRSDFAIGARLCTAQSRGEGLAIPRKAKFNLPIATLPLRPRESQILA